MKSSNLSRKPRKFPPTPTPVELIGSIVCAVAGFVLANYLAGNISF